MNHERSIELAARMGKFLEEEGVYEAGVAISLLLGTFILQFGGKEKQIREGIQSISKDAESAAIKIYRSRN